MNFDALACADAVRSGQVSPTDLVQQVLSSIQALDPKLNAFTTVLADQALAQAAQLQQTLAEGQDPGPLAGVPFAVKNLFDIEGCVTLSGSWINREQPPASRDAAAVAKLKAAGAILVGALNMDEYAYGFVTENTHYGPVHNPHHLKHIAGGSSGGSAAVVAAGIVPISLGSDTNGSVRVPAALCGIWGLKPTYGLISRAGMGLFCASLDHVGTFARSVRDTALMLDLLQGYDPQDPVSAERSVDLSQLEQGVEGLSCAALGGYFAQGSQPQVQAALSRVMQALNSDREVEIPEAARARAAAYLITASEGANLHLEDLRIRPQDFDPATRDRFLAGALLPSQWVIQAQRFRAWYRQQVQQIFRAVDILVAPTTPCVAPLIGQTLMEMDGVEVLLRPNLGLYTQPLSLIGLPVISVPVTQPGCLPIGIQLIAAPFQEAKLLRVAHHLQEQGFGPVPIPKMPAIGLE